MPATYAHRRFGEEMLSLYPEDTRDAVEKHRNLFSIGLHGPDLLFYYRPLTSHPVQSIGYRLHDKKGCDFFIHGAQVWKESGYSREVFAYLAGFLCHFALDTVCHSYIEKKLSVSTLYHAELETEFDKYLLREEGKDPFREDLVSHIAATPQAAEVIAPLFHGIDEAFAPVEKQHILRAIKGMRFHSHMLQGKNPVKRGIIWIALKCSGQYPELHGMVFARRDLPACRDSNLRLKKLFEQAKGLCLRLTENLIAFARGQEELLAEFQRTFGPQPGWETIPVFSEEEEALYEIPHECD